MVLPQNKAPWTEDEVLSLNAYQNSRRFHPFTCQNGHGALTATSLGWFCTDPQCGYTQNWAHTFLTNWNWQREDHHP